MTFHEFKDTKDLWAHVFPGDGLICPGCIAYRHEDFFARTTKTKVLTLHKSPTMVLARIDGVIGDPLARDQWKYCTFVLWTRHGPLCTIMQVAP